MNDQARPERSDIKPEETGPPEYSVSEISQGIRQTLEQTYGRVRVRGELSKVTVARSGHMYSDLKDDKSVLSVVCWRGVMGKLSISPEEGLEVICTGRITAYAGRSSYQLSIEAMELAGEGALLKMLEARKKKLLAEGLFETERKKQLPKLPNLIGVITSPTGAVIRDILHRLEDRFPRPVLVWGANVQGRQAINDVVSGIRGFNSLSGEKRPDLLIVARGGGSLEDLMPFNSEEITRAVAESEIPIISAVGHETDTTLCDLAADMRAPTPSAAAELAVPVRHEILEFINNLAHRRRQALHNRLKHDRAELKTLQASLRDPNHLIEPMTQTIDILGRRLESGLTALAQHKTHALNQVTVQLRKPQQIVREAAMKLEGLGRLLKSYSYETVLERGFVLVRNKEGEPVKHATSLSVDDSLALTFADGERRAKVTD